MKEDAFLDGISNIESDVVERFISMDNKLQKKASNSKAKGIWLRFGAIAACLAIIAGAIFLVPMLREDDPGEIPGPGGILPPGTDNENEKNNIPILNTQAPSSAPQYYGSEKSEAGGTSAEVNTEGISVIARLLEILPDIYTFYDDWKQTEFYLLKMETIKLLKGEKMTDTFYYIVPERFMRDFAVFDKFVIVDMAQYGYEHSVLYNKTQNRAEGLDIVLLGYLNTYFDPMGENFMAFDADGNFVWSPSEWLNNKYANGYTLAQAEEEHSYADGYRYVHTLESLIGEAADALEYIKSFENGLYIPDGDGWKAAYSPEVQLGFRRYINGFATNESGMIYLDSASYSKAKFTKEDENALPDLTSAYAAVKNAFENGEILPPHIQKYEEMENTTYGIFGWYAKTEDGIIGVVRVTWCYLSDSYKLHFDDAYYIVEYGSNECKAIERDLLLEKLGQYEKDYVYTGKYDEYGKARYVIPV